MRLPCSSALASAGSAATAAAIVACALSASADAGVVSVIGSQATAQLSGPAPTVQDTFLISSLLTEFYYAEQMPGNGYAAFAVDVKASSLKFTFDFEGISSMSFASGVSFQLTFSPLYQIDSFSVGSVDAGVSGVDAADLSRLGNVVTVDLSGISAANAGDSFILNFSASAVPGPASLAALAGLAAARRRRR